MQTMISSAALKRLAPVAASLWLAACGGGGGSTAEGGPSPASAPSASPVAAGPSAPAAPAAAGPSAPTSGPVALAPSAGGTPAPAPAPEWIGTVAVGTTADGQDGPSLARLSNGQTVVAWPTSERGTKQIKVQRYDDAGAAIGDAIRIDAPSEPPTFGGSSQGASVAATPTGYVVSWCAFKDPLSGTPGFPEPGWDVFMRRFEVNGAPLGEVVHVNVEPSSACPLASVAVRADGKLGVAYKSYQFQHAPGFNPGKCLVRTFDGAGTGSAPTSLGEADNCQATALPDNGFAVVLGRPHYMGAEGVFLSRFDAGGARVGDEVFIDGTPRSTTLPGFASANDPAIATLPDGNLALAWSRDHSSVMAQKFTPSGVALGNPFLAAATGARPKVAALADGGFALAWGGGANGATSTTEIWSQRFESTGSARDRAVRVTSSANIYGPRGFDVTASSNGRSVIGWKEPVPAGGFNVFIGRH